MPSADTATFPFPSINLDLRLTVSREEVATVLAVDLSHITRLIQSKALEVCASPIGTMDWINVKSYRRFVLSRVEVVSSPRFPNSISYDSLVTLYEGLKDVVPDSWKYQPSRLTPNAQAFTIPSALRLAKARVTEPVLRLDQVANWLLFPSGCNLETNVRIGVLDWAIDVRTDESSDPVIRVPVETYHHWICQLLTGPDHLEFLAAQPESILLDIFRELCGYLGAGREDKP